MLLDEYVEVVNNLVYMNMIVKLNFEFVYEVLLNVFDSWKMIVENMYVLFDVINNYYLEYDGY